MICEHCAGDHRIWVSTSSDGSDGTWVPCPVCQAHPVETLRDRFAMAALNGHLSDVDMVLATKNAAAERGLEITRAAAMNAYEYADAMLEARKT